MSRIGKKPIEIPAGVEVKLDGAKVTVKGAKGTLEHVVAGDIKVAIEGNEVIVTRPNDEKENRSLHGLTRTLIANMIEGGRTPNLTSKDLENLGFDIVFWPCTLVYTVTKALGDVLRALRDEGTTNNVHDKMLSFSQFNSFIGLDDYNELDKKYK